VTFWHLLTGGAIVGLVPFDLQNVIAWWRGECSMLP
jgi:hypothetical protein